MSIASQLLAVISRTLDAQRRDLNASGDLRAVRFDVHRLSRGRWFVKFEKTNEDEERVRMAGVLYDEDIPTG